MLMCLIAVEMIYVKLEKTLAIVLMIADLVCQIALAKTAGIMAAAEVAGHVTTTISVQQTLA